MSEWEQSLGDLRASIDSVDARLAALLNERARLVGEIYALKDQHGAPRFSRGRTQAILRRLALINQGPLKTAQLRALFIPLLEFFARDYQVPDVAGTDRDACRDRARAGGK